MRTLVENQWIQFTMPFINTFNREVRLCPLRVLLGMMLVVSGVAPVATSVGAEPIQRGSYTGIEASPFPRQVGGERTRFLWDDFESGKLSLPGVSFVRDGIGFIEYQETADSIEVGSSGTGMVMSVTPRTCFISFPALCPATVGFKFSAEALGTLPSYVGFVWTDAFRSSDENFFPYARIRAYDAQGVRIDDRTLPQLPVQKEGEHANNLFLAYVHPQGISQIEFTVVTDGTPSGGHLSLDHLQIGTLPQIGDTNLDGQVEFQDFLELSRNFGMDQKASWSHGDFNLDEAVQFGDFLALASHFSAKTESSVTPAPEPSCGVLLIGTALAWFRKRGLRQRTPLG